MMDDADGWIDLFVDDGVFDVPGLNRFEGPEGLRNICNVVIEGSQGNWRHTATNVLVTPGPHADEVAVRLRTWSLIGTSIPPAHNLMIIAGRLCASMATGALKS